MELGPYAAEIGLTPESLESGTVTSPPSKVKVGLVFEILKYAKKVNVSSQQSARWILSLFAELPGNKDDQKLLDYVRRSASRKYVKREKVRGKKRQDFLDSVFELPSHSQLGERENQHPSTGDSRTLTKIDVDADLTTMAKVKGSYSLRRHNQGSLELMMECEEDELSPWQIEASRRALDDYEKAMQRINAAKTRQMMQQQKTLTTTALTMTPTKAAAAPPTPPPSTRSSSPDVIIVGETPATRTPNPSRTSTSQIKSQLHSNQSQSSSVPTTSMLSSTISNPPHSATGGKVHESHRRGGVESPGTKTLSQRQSQPQEYPPRVITSIFANHDQPSASGVPGSQNDRVITGTYGYGIKRPEGGDVIAIKRPSEIELMSSPSKKKAQRKTSADAGSWVPLDEYYYGKMEGDPSYWEDKGEYRFKCWYCSKMLYNNVRTMMHMQAHIDSEKQQNLDLSDLTQCKHCYKQFDTPFEMQTHIEKVHMNNANVLLCRICEKDHDSRHALTNHMRQVHTACEMPYICQMCNFRSSMYSDAVDHFKKKHDSSQSILCLYCLKVFRVKFVSNGWGQTQIYYHHLLKHQSKTNSRKCPICKLTFFNSIEVKNHRRKDHQPNQKGVIDVDARYLTADQVMIKLPELSGVPKEKSVKSLNAPALTKVKDYHGMKLPDYMESYKCVECKTAMNTLGHFRKYIECSMCRFATSCSTAYATHMMGFHSGRLTNVSINIPTEKQMDEPMYCLCGFGSRFGNKIANHMVYCIKKTCYAQKPEVTWVEVDELDEELNYDDPRRRPGASILDVLGLVKKQTLLPGSSAFMKSIEAGSKTYADDSKSPATLSDGANPKLSDLTKTEDGDAIKKESAAGESLSEEGAVDAEFSNWRKLCIEEFELEPDKIEKLINRDIADEWTLEEWNKISKNCLTYGFWFAITDYIYSCEDYTFVKILPRIFENIFLDPPENISNFLSRIKRRLKRGGVDWIKEIFLEHQSNIGPLCDKLSIDTDVLEGHKDSTISADQITKAVALELLYYKKRNPNYTYSNLSVWMMNIFSLQKPPNTRELRFQLEGIHRLKNKVCGHKAEVVKLLKEPFEPVESSLADDDLEDPSAHVSPAVSDSVEDSIHSTSTDKKDIKDFLSDEELSQSPSFMEDNREESEEEEHINEENEGSHAYLGNEGAEKKKMLNEETGEQEKKKAVGCVEVPDKHKGEGKTTDACPDSEKPIANLKRLHSELEKEPIQNLESTKKNEASSSFTDEKKKDSDVGNNNGKLASPKEKRMRLDVDRSENRSKESIVVSKISDQETETKISEISSGVTQRKDSVFPEKKDESVSKKRPESSEKKEPRTTGENEGVIDEKNKHTEQPAKLFEAKINKAAEFKQEEKLKSLDKKTEEHQSQKVKTSDLSMEKSKLVEGKMRSSEMSHDKAKLAENPQEKTSSAGEKLPKSALVDKIRSTEEKPLDKAKLSEKPLDKAKLSVEEKHLDEAKLSAEEKPCNEAKLEENPHEKSKSTNEKPKEASSAGEKPHEKSKSTNEKPKEASSAGEKPHEKSKSTNEKPKEASSAGEKPLEKSKSTHEKPKEASSAGEKPHEKSKSTHDKPKEASSAGEKPHEKSKSTNEKPKEASSAGENPLEKSKSTHEKPKEASSAGEKPREKPHGKAKSAGIPPEKVRSCEKNPQGKAKLIEEKSSEKAVSAEKKYEEEAKSVEKQPQEMAKSSVQKPQEKAKFGDIKPYEKLKASENPNEKTRLVEEKPAEKKLYEKTKSGEETPNELVKLGVAKPEEKDKSNVEKPHDKAKADGEKKPWEKTVSSVDKPYEMAKLTDQPTDKKTQEKAPLGEEKPNEKAKSAEEKTHQKTSPSMDKPAEKAMVLDEKTPMAQDESTNGNSISEMKKTVQSSIQLSTTKCMDEKSGDKTKPEEQKTRLTERKHEPPEQKPKLTDQATLSKTQPNNPSKLVEGKPQTTESKHPEKSNVAEKTKPVEEKKISEEKSKPGDLKSNVSEQKSGQAQDRAKPTAEEISKLTSWGNEKPKSTSALSGSSKVFHEEKQKPSPLSSADQNPRLSCGFLEQKSKVPSTTSTEQKVRPKDLNSGEQKIKPTMSSNELNSMASPLEKKPATTISSSTDPKPKSSPSPTDEKPKQPLKSSTDNSQISVSGGTADPKPKLSSQEPKSNLPTSEKAKSASVETLQKKTDESSKVKTNPDPTKSTVIKPTEVKAADDKSKPLIKAAENTKSVIKMTDKSLSEIKTQVEPTKSEPKIESRGSVNKECKDTKSEGQSSQYVGIAAKTDPVEDPCKEDNKVTVIKMASSSSSSSLVVCPPSTASVSSKTEKSSTASQDKPSSVTSSAKSESTNSNKPQISSSKDDKIKSDGSKETKTGSTSASSAGDGQTSVITPTKKVDDPTPTSESTSKKPESSSQKPVLPSPSSSEKTESHRHEGSPRHNERSSSSSSNSSVQPKGSDRSKDYSSSARDSSRDRNQSQRDRSHDRDYRNPSDRPYHSRDDYADKHKYGSSSYDNRNQPPQRGPYGNPDYRGPGGAPGHFGGSGRDFRGGHNHNRGRGHPNRGFDNNWHGGRGGRGGYGGNYHGGYRGNYY